MCTRKIRSLLATLLSAATLGCRDDGPRIVILDGWWSRDFAAHACAQALSGQGEQGGPIAQAGCEAVQGCPPAMPAMPAMPALLACASDGARTLAKTFDRRVLRALAGEPACAGVTMARHDGPGEQDVGALDLARRPHWTLAVDYRPGLDRQGWTLLSATAPSIAADGEGTAGQIARQVCAVVKGAGGRAPQALAGSGR